MSCLVLLAAVVLLLLAGVAAAEPKQVDTDWQRSDEAHVEIETPADVLPEIATPETTEESDGAAAANIAASSVLLMVLAAAGFILLLASYYFGAMSGLWRRLTRREQA